MTGGGGEDTIGAWIATGVPHFEQNRASGASGAPQFAH
jgi:hypothetical protein